MESQPQNPEFRINPENFHPCMKGLIFHLKHLLAQDMACLISRQIKKIRGCLKYFKIKIPCSNFKIKIPCSNNMGTSMI